MSAEVHVLGVDPGFASVGYAVVSLLAHGNTPVEMGVIRTQKANAKRKVRASDDNLERAKEIYAALAGLVDTYQIKVLCAETMSYPRNAGAAAKMAICWGIVAALAHSRGLAVVQASPQDVKKALCGKKDASKEDVQAALLDRYSALKADVTNPKNTRILRDVTPSQYEHPFDALAVVEACNNSDVLLLTRRMVANARAEQGGVIR